MVSQQPPHSELQGQKSGGPQNGPQSADAVLGSLPEELRVVVERWPRLPEAVKRAIVGLSSIAT